MAKKRKNPSETMPEIFDDEEFGQFRYIKRGEEIWFVAVDLCRALDLENVTKALYPLADDETNTFTISKGIVGNPKMRFVNESGLYRLIFASRKPEAEKFRRWVTHEVLPSIRKTGSYSVSQSQYDFFHPSPEERERHRKIKTIEGIIEDLEAHGLEWDWEPSLRIEKDEKGVERVVQRFELVIKHPEYEKLRKQRRIKEEKESELLTKSRSSVEE